MLRSENSDGKAARDAKRKGSGNKESMVKFNSKLLIHLCLLCVCLFLNQRCDLLGQFTPKQAATAAPQVAIPPWTPGQEKV